MARAQPQIRSEVAIKLKGLRESTRPKLTVRKVAELLGIPSSTYASYEDKFKQTHLPVKLVRQLAPIFEKRGVEAADVLALGGIADAYEERERPNPDWGPSHMAEIDEVDSEPSAGAGANVGDSEVLRTWVIPRNVVDIATESPLSRVKIVRIKGDSMVPMFNPLDRIMVDTGDTVPSPGGIFVVWDGLGFVVKRVQVVPHSDPLSVKITSDNPKYDPYQRVLGEAYIQGRVIGKWLWT
jgi:hypothetical protein